jgi:hypothetical protein
MHINFIDGRDFRPGDVQPQVNGKAIIAGAGIVNEAFARKYFDGQNPVGRTAYARQSKDAFAPVRIVGYVRDAAYSSVRERFRPTVYVPIAERSGGTFVLRSTLDLRVLTPMLRNAVPRARSGLHVVSIESQTALARRQMIRERLLATLSFFFGVVALILATVGLYGVLNFSVIQHRREIGIRMALGAPSAHVVRRVTTGMLLMVSVGSVIGLAAGLAGAQLLEALLFDVKSTDVPMMAAPVLLLFAAAASAALPPVIRAVRLDPARTLRSE